MSESDAEPEIHGEHGEHHQIQVEIHREDWEYAINKSIPGLVSIRSISVRGFDSSTQKTSQATGFVVAPGIILSNRHVVGPGPTLAEAIFTKTKEEVQLRALYRDPVHDFGFYAFDDTLKHMAPNCIPLAPERVRVGLEIRVLGNDNGESLDRKAPAYGVGKYNDFNTFYYQAASMTSGGSSGSPVIDKDGYAVALNAGGSIGAASSFFLPLDRVVSALDLLIKGVTVPRGTLQTIFVSENYDEVKRLGVSLDLETCTRVEFPNSSGMLVVRQVLDKGPAFGILESGDVLISVNGFKTVGFVPLETILDTFVNQEIALEIVRGSMIKSVTIPVQDLHSITPDRLLEVGGGIVHDLSYQMAKSYNVPVEGVFVASPGYMLGLAGISKKCIIESIHSQPTPNLDAFIGVMNTLGDNARVPIRFYQLSDINKPKITIIQVDRRWHGYKIAKRNDSTGLWDYTSLPPCSGDAIWSPHTAIDLKLDDSLGPAKCLIASLVHVEFRMPFKCDGVQYQTFTGIGLVVDALRGWIVVDRNTIPTSIGDILLTFANSITIVGRLLYLHQFYNLAIVGYDTSLLGDTNVVSAILSDVSLNQGDSVYVVCLTKSYQPIVRKTIVSSIRQFYVSEPSPPSYRAINVEGIELENPISHGGILSNSEGHVQALHLCHAKHGKVRSEFYMGLSVQALKPILSALLSPDPTDLDMRGLDVELAYTQIAQARILGLSDEWVKRIECTHNSRRNVLLLRRITSGTLASKVLVSGDLLLAINGVTATTFDDVTSQTQSDSLTLTILRDSKELKVQVPLSTLEKTGTERIIGWAGAVFQSSHRQLYQTLKNVPEGVYCCIVSDGSPAQLYGIQQAHWITSINDTPVSNLDSFLNVVSKIPTDTFVRVKMVSMNRLAKMVTVRTNTHYFGCWELVRDAQKSSGWSLTSV